MANVKTENLSAMMNQLNERLKGKLADHAKTINKNVNLNINTPPDYAAAYGLVNRDEVIRLAVAITKIYQTDGRGSDLQKAIFSGGQGANFSTLIDNVSRSLKDSTKHVNTDSMKIFTGNIDTVSGLSDIINKIQTEAGEAIKKETPLACKLFDGLLAVALQSVPLVGNVLSSASKNGIADTILSAGGTIAKTQLGNKLGVDPSNPGPSDKSLNFKYEGYTLGQHMSATNSKGLEVKNNLLQQAAFNTTGKAIDSANEQAANYLKNSGANLGKALTTPLNTTSLYSILSERMKKQYNIDVSTAVDDKEFFKKVLTDNKYNKYMSMQNNSGDLRSDLFDFESRGVSIENHAITESVSKILDGFKETFNGDESETMKKCLKTFQKKMAAYRSLVDACLESNFVEAMGPAIKVYDLKTLNVKYTLTSNDPTKKAAVIIAAVYLYKKIKSEQSLQLYLKNLARLDNSIDVEFMECIDPHAFNGSTLHSSRASTTINNDIDSHIENRRNSIIGHNANYNEAKSAGKNTDDILNKIAVSKTKLASLQGQKAELNYKGDSEILNPIFTGKLSAYIDKDRSQNTIQWQELTNKSINFIEHAKDCVRKEIQATFPPLATTGIEDALRTLVASNIIISNVHAAIAANKTIQIEPGAAKLLSTSTMSSAAVRGGDKPIRGFVKLYSKTLGLISSSQKENLEKSRVYANKEARDLAIKLVKTGRYSQEEIAEITLTDLHSLRFPDGTGLLGIGGASVREVTRLYMFACTVVSYTDVGAITIGFSNWNHIREFLNTAIKEINSITANLSDDDEKSLAKHQSDIKEENKKSDKERAAADERAKTIKKQEKQNTEILKNLSKESRTFGQALKDKLKFWK